MRILVSVAFLVWSTAAFAAVTPSELMVLDSYPHDAIIGDSEIQKFEHGGQQLLETELPAKPALSADSFLSYRAYRILMASA